MKKRLLMMLSILLTAVGGVNSQTAYWTSYAASEFSQTDEDIIYINDNAELALLAVNVNGGTSYEGKTIVLNTDLNLEQYQWYPIGSDTDRQFKGTFDGNGKTISGMTVNGTHVGLFGCIEGGTVKDLKIANSSIYLGGNVVGDAAGAIVAWLSGGTITGCYIDKDVNIRAKIAGGVVGRAFTNSEVTIEGCYSDAQLKASTSYHALGGIVGILEDRDNTGSVKHCIVGADAVFNENNYSTETVPNVICAHVADEKNYLSLDYNYYFGTSLDPGVYAKKPLEITCEEGLTLSLPGAKTSKVEGGISYIEGAAGVSIGGKIYAGELVGTSYTQPVKVGVSVDDEPDVVSSKNMLLSYTTSGSANATKIPLTPQETPNLYEFNFALEQYHQSPYTIKYDYQRAQATDVGTKTVPYEIDSKRMMNLLATRVNENNNYVGKHFILTCDLNYSAVTSTETDNYTPVGYYGTKSTEYYFGGTFDGQGHTIKGISTSQDYSGVFGYIAHGTVKNLNVDESSFTGKYAGAIVGYASDYTFENCIIGQNVIVGSGTSQEAGGIIGSMAEGQKIQGCVVSAQVQGINAGGFIGKVAESGGTVTLTNNLYLGNSITGTNTNVYVGDINGNGNWYHNEVNGDNVTRAFYTNTSLKNIADPNENIDVFACAFTNIAAAEGEVLASYGDDGKGIKAYSNGLVYDGKLYVAEKDLEWEGEGSVDNPYLITNTLKMDYLAFKVNGGEDYDGNFFKLTNNLEYGATIENNYTAIGLFAKPFSGTFDGYGYKISGININKENDDHQGLFGAVDGGTVKNLVVDGAVIKGKDYVGGIVGQLKRSSVNASAMVANCRVYAGNISGNDYVGGVVGMEGYLVSSDTQAEHCSIEGCVSTAEVSGHDAVGGVLGQINYLGSLYNNLYLGSANDVTQTGAGIGLITGRIGAQQFATVEKNYYTDSNGTSTGVYHGEKAITYSAVDYISSTATSNKTYSVRGEEDLKEYVNGLRFGEQFYSTEATLIPVRVELVDGTAYDSEGIYAGKAFEKISYTRTLSAGLRGKYKGWFVPFDMEVTSDLNENFTFFRINMVAGSATGGEDEGSNKLWIHVSSMAEGEVLHANMPYLFKEKDGVDLDSYTFEVSNTALTAKNEGVLAYTATMQNTYNFYGVYDSRESADNDQFYYMDSKGGFSYTEDYERKNGGKRLKVKSYRWVFNVVPKDGMSSNYAPARYVIDIVEDGEEATAITSAETDKVEAVRYYTMDGIEVTTPGRGLHIVKYANGETKKVFIK